jgi:Tfx family DNA-binding protein
LLTDKEIQVLELRKKGLTQAEVANSLKISQAAVSHFEKNAIAKLKDAHSTVKLSKKLLSKKALEEVQNG